MKDEYLKNFKDGISDALIIGQMSDNRPDGYKQGYDFAISVYVQMEESNQEYGE